MNELKVIIEKFNSDCVNCGLCTDFCSHHTAMNQMPKHHTTSLLNQLDATTLSQSAFHCNECGRCSSVCPKNLDYRHVHTMVKRKVFPLNTKVPTKAAKLTVDFHQMGHFHPLLNHKVKGLKESVNSKVFFPGCALIQNSPEIVEKVYEFLHSSDDSIGLMSNCCGKPTLTIGDTSKHHKRMLPIVKQVEKLGIEEIIVACPNCLKTLTEILPNTKITFITSALVKYNYPVKATGSPITVSVHDPCPTRNHQDVHDDIREIINSSGFNILERDYIGKNTLCCGSGGMLKVVQPDTNQKYVDKFMTSFHDNTAVITYCMECKESITNAGIKTYHILEVLFADNCHLIPSLSSFQRWKNRYKYIKKQSKRQA